MAVDPRVDQLHIDMRAVARFLHAPFEDRGDAEFARDRSDVFGMTPILLSGGTRDNLQIIDRGQFC